MNARMMVYAKLWMESLAALVNLASKVTHARQSIAVTVPAKTEALAHLGLVPVKLASPEHYAKHLIAM